MKLEHQWTRNCFSEPSGTLLGGNHTSLFIKNIELSVIDRQGQYKKIRGFYNREKCPSHFPVALLAKGRFKVPEHNIQCNEFPQTITIFFPSFSSIYIYVLPLLSGNCRTPEQLYLSHCGLVEEKQPEYHRLGTLDGPLLCYLVTVLIGRKTKWWNMLEVWRTTCWHMSSEELLLMKHSYSHS